MFAWHGYVNATFFDVVFWQDFVSASAAATMVATALYFWQQKRDKNRLIAEAEWEIILLKQRILPLLDQVIYPKIEDPTSLLPPKINKIVKLTRRRPLKRWIDLLPKEQSLLAECIKLQMYYDLFITDMKGVFDNLEAQLALDDMEIPVTVRSKIPPLKSKEQATLYLQFCLGKISGIEDHEFLIARKIAVTELPLLLQYWDTLCANQIISQKIVQIMTGHRRMIQDISERMTTIISEEHRALLPHTSPALSGEPRT